MALFEVADKGTGLRRVELVSLIAEGVKERQDLQRWLRDEPSALGENLFVIAEEFGEWEDSRRRIDLLALDEDANLVVVELKRTDDGGHMDLQAIRYAAMVSSMTWENVVQAHDAFLRERKLEGNARERLEKFLGTEAGETPPISTVPRIILVSADFSLEITTTVLWLVERGIDIRCMQVESYKVEDRLFLEIKQVLPLEEATDYQVKIRQKDETVRRTTTGKQRERTLAALARNGEIAEGTEIEIVPAARPDGADGMDPRTFCARIVDVHSRDSLEWHLDGNRYSASSLLWTLTGEHGVRMLANNTFMHWRVVGQTRSMWDQAEGLTRGERFRDHTE